MTATGAPLGRRALLELALVALVAEACGAPSPAIAPVAPPTLALPKLVDLVKAPGLVSLVEVTPRAALADDTWLAAVLEVVPDARFRAFAAHNGKVDPRYLEELVVARYDHATLVLGRGTLEPVALHEAFATRALAVTGRTQVVASPPVVRLVGERDKEPLALTTFGAEAFAYETGKGSALRVAELYAQKKLHKAKPALLAPPLAEAAALLGPAAARAFVVGPFDGEWEGALGGLLRAATAVGLAIRSPEGGKGRLRASAVVLGAFDHAKDDAVRSLGASVDLLLGKNPLGKMCGLDEPVESPVVVPVPGGLRVDATFDAQKLASGVHRALDAEISEIMKDPK